MRTILCLYFLMTCLISFGSIRHVPSNYTTVTQALSSCQAGDTVLVQPGVYFENIIWPAVASIKLFSTGDSINTVIHGNQVNRTLRFDHSIIDSMTIVKGFTITGGYISNGSTGHGAGIYVQNGRPTFLSLLIKDNKLNVTNWAYGAGVYLKSSGSVFKNCAIEQNVTETGTWGYGGGVYITGSSFPFFIDCSIQQNIVKTSTWNYGTGIYSNGGSINLINVIVAGNQAADSASYYYGQGVYLENTDAILKNVLISENTQGKGGNFYYGAGIYSKTSGQIDMNHVTCADNKRSDNGTINGSGIYIGAGISMEIVNSIFWNNNSSAEISNLGNVSINYSIIRGGFSGTSNFNTNPLLAGNGNFIPPSNSVAINAGSFADSLNYDLNGNTRPLPALTNPDIGCYEVDQPLGLSSTLSQFSDFRIYPNPVEKHMFVELKDQKAIGAINVYTVDGKEVFISEKQLTGNKLKKIDVSYLPAGMYIIQYMDQYSRRSSSFIKH